jgi:hypothetical protein
VKPAALGATLLLAAAQLPAGAMAWSGNAVPPAARPVLVAHLPTTPSDPRQLAVGINALAEHLRSAVPGLPLEVRMFRRWRDVRAFLDGPEASRLALVLADHLAIPDLAGDCELEPAYRFVRGGRETTRHLVVVRRRAGAVPNLAALRGRSLSLAEARAPLRLLALRELVFEGLVAPAEWFGSLREEPDELTAAANVLYAHSDAALVGEGNPLLAEHLGESLLQVYASPPLSLPVLGACRRGTSERQRELLSAALAGLPRTAAGREALAALAIDGLRRVPEGDGRLERGGLLRLPRSAVTLAVAPPPPLPPPPAVLPSLAPGDLAFWLAVERPRAGVPELPIDTGAGGPR